MQKVIGESGYQNVLLVDVYNNLLNSGFELEMLMEDDGHHITPLAHSLYSKELIRQEALHFKVNA